MKRFLVLGVALALMLPACASDDEGNKTARVVVFGAASLTEAFTDIAEAYENEHPGVSVVLSFASSSDLAAQIEQGAEADVFASADVANMARLSDQDLTDGNGELFATNHLEIIVQPGNPLGITELADLANDELIMSIAAPEVPAGKYAAQTLEAARIEVSPDSLEVDVKAVVTRVSLGEADVGIVYATDAIAAGSNVEGVAIPAAENVTAEYPIAALFGASEEATSFIEFVLAQEGQAFLAERGFGTP